MATLFLSLQKMQKCGEGCNQSCAADIPFGQETLHFLCVTQMGAFPDEYLMVAAGYLVIGEYQDTFLNQNKIAAPTPGPC